MSVCRLVLALLLLSASSRGGVVRIDVHERSSLLDGKKFGTAGVYERLRGKVHFEVDPSLPANRIISDVDLAPRNARGRIEFSSDFYLMVPLEAAKGNGTLLFEVSNRGRKGMLGMFNRAGASLDPRTEAELGDEFLLNEGFALAWLGWQFDVPADPALMRLDAPRARNGNQPIRGLVRSEYIPDRRVLSFSLADRTMIAYPVADPDDRKLKLTVRDRREGQRRTIPRSQWQFARNDSGRPVLDRTQVFMASGFEPGKIYELVYTAEDPVLVGLGPAAVRDFIAFLKHGDPGLSRNLFPGGARQWSRAIGFGISQSGRFLRTFLFYGFNQDEQRQRVFDGVLAHVAGAGRGSFNHRFAQPSRDGHPFMNCFYPTDIFPFADLDQTDPETGLTGGILSRAIKDAVVPKIFYTNSSYEYYGRAASLIHTTVDGKQDARLARDTRIYLLAGAQHGPASFPPGREGTQQLANPNDFRWSMRALLLALNRWVATGKEPPDSQYPKIANGTLVPLSALKFPAIPGVRLPQRIQTAYRLDFGPGFRSAGVVSTEPPNVGKPFPTLVPQVGADGNELAGIRLPEIRVPLATFTGWNLRDPALGAAEELFSMVGSFIPFARSRTERVKDGDSRLSIEERYSSRHEYLAKITAAANELAQEGYLLEADVPHLVNEAGQRWDYLTSPPPDSRAVTGR